MRAPRAGSGRCAVIADSVGMTGPPDAARGAAAGGTAAAGTAAGDVSADDVSAGRRSGFIAVACSRYVSVLET
jgi:hypothetical protein